MQSGILLFESRLEFVINVYCKLILLTERKWNYIKCSVKTKEGRKKEGNKEQVQ